MADVIDLVERAFFEHGDIMAEDPTCFFEPEDETTVCEHEDETNRMFKRYAFMARHAARMRDGVKGDETVVLTRGDQNDWSVETRDGYPADSGKRDQNTNARLFGVRHTG